MLNQDQRTNKEGNSCAVKVSKDKNQRNTEKKKTITLGYISHKLARSVKEKCVKWKR